MEFIPLANAKKKAKKSEQVEVVEKKSKKPIKNVKVKIDKKLGKGKKKKGKKHQEEDEEEEDIDEIEEKNEDVEEESVEEEEDDEEDESEEEKDKKKKIMDEKKKNRLFIKMKKKIHSESQIKELHPEIRKVIFPRKKKTRWCWAVFASQERAEEAFKKLLKNKEVIVTRPKPYDQVLMKKEKKMKEIDRKKDAKKKLQNMWV